MQFPHIKYKIQWVLVFLQSCAITTTKLHFLCVYRFVCLDIAISGIM